METVLMLMMLWFLASCALAPVVGRALREDHGPTASPADDVRVLEPRP